jgi:hypothetical protein
MRAARRRSAGACPPGVRGHDLIQTQFYDGTPSALHPEAGTLPATSAVDFSPTLLGNLAAGDYL